MVCVHCVVWSSGSEAKRACELFPCPNVVRVRLRSSVAMIVRGAAARKFFLGVVPGAHEAKRNDLQGLRVGTG